MSINGKTNYRYIDHYKAIAIILVILGHANFANESIKAWIYAFHMPAFFFASGLVLRNDNDTNIKACANTIWKKVQRLIFPYFIWALIYTSLNPINVAKIIYGSHVMLNSAGTLTSLWFLTTLFMALLFYEVAKLLFKKKFNLPLKIVLMILTFCVAAILPDIKNGYPWNLNIAFFAFGFILLGNISFPVIQRFRNGIIGIKGGRYKSIVICSAAILVSFAGTLLYQFNIPDNSSFIRPSRAVYGFFPLFVLVAMIGISMVTFISILLDILLPINRKDVLAFIGQNTLCIFLIHKPFVQLLFGKLFSVISVPAPIALIVTCIGTLGISCLLTLFINRYFPPLVGKIPKPPKEFPF